MKIRLKVIKADGSVEEYLHTKIIGTMSNALACVDQSDICIAEQLAEVVTYFLYHGSRRRSITSSELSSVVKASLAATGYEEAAIALSEHRCQRRLKRSRVEVVSVDVCELSDAERLSMAEESGNRSRWDKSRIVDSLVTKYGLCRQTARTVALMVEEKIFSMGLTLVPVSLIRQLVLGDTAAVLRAERQLQIV